MSIDTMHVALAGEQQLQQMVGNPDPRIAIPAAAKLAKLIQLRKSQQGGQAMGEAPAPTVKDQLQQAAAPQQPPPESGIAMAAGGMVQRNFEGGGSEDTSPFMRDVGDTWDAFKYKSTHDPETPEQLAAQAQAQATREANRQPSFGEEVADYVSRYFSKPSTTAASDAEKAARAAQRPVNIASGLDEAAQAAARTKRQLGSAGVTPVPTVQTAAQPVARNPKAPTPTAAPGAGLSAAVSQADVTSAASAAKPDEKGAPQDSYMAGAKALLDQLSPLQAKAMEQMTGARSAEEARYKAMQAAKHDPNAFVDAMNRIVALTRPFAVAHGGGLGNFGSLSEGAYNLAQTQQGQRTRQAQEDADHQRALAGIDAGMTQQQIKNLMGNNTITTGARAADDKQDMAETGMALRQSQHELAKLKADEAKRVDNARIAKLQGGAGGPKPMTPAALANAKLRIESMVAGTKHPETGLPLTPQEQEAKRAALYAASGIQSSAPAPAPTGRVLDFSTIK
jgi:hypothetical protein